MRKKIYMVMVVALSMIYVSTIKSYAQELDSIHSLVVKQKLDNIILTDSTYCQRMDFSVNNMSVSELLRSIAKVSGLNMNVNFGPEKHITCNFKQIRIVDIIYFVCREYGLDVENSGGILTVTLYHVPVKEPVVKLDYDADNQQISFDFSNVKLTNVAREFSEKTGVNIVVPRKLFDYKVSSFGHSMTLENAIQTIAAVNSLTVNKKDDKTWMMYQTSDERNNPLSQNEFSFRQDELLVDSLGLVTAKIANGNVRTVLQDICKRMKVNYFFTENMDYSTGIFVERVDFDTFLKVLFTGTGFTWRVESGIYLFGKANDTGLLSSVKVFPMKYRTVDKVVDIIPTELKKGQEIITFPDLNSLVVSGDQSKMMQLSTFLLEIDKSVPLVSIDVIIVDATDTSTREAGISMGLGKEPTTTYGTLSPGVKFSLNGASINKLINSFNGFGSINLGKVNPNFYMGLKLLEENGRIMLRSTPRLSTLNGHKATLKSGETKYYKESQTNIIGTQNPLQSESYQWKNVEANLTLDITPFVSLDSCITLQIDLSQSEFTEREVEGAPPGTTNRSFNSIIKVKNQEMVLLGGIERNLTSQTSSGLPLVARIPVLRWIFGSSSKNKKSQKLNVFIKPTIIN